jgi:hypothetical protein
MFERPLTIRPEDAARGRLDDLDLKQHHTNFEAVAEAACAGCFICNHWLEWCKNYCPDALTANMKTWKPEYKIVDNKDFSIAIYLQAEGAEEHRPHVYVPLIEVHPTADESYLKMDIASSTGSDATWESV